MNVLLNGELAALQDGLTAEGLLAHLGLTGVPVALEVNREIVRREARATLALREGDRVEIVTFVGGG